MSELSLQLVAVSGVLPGVSLGGAWLTLAQDAGPAVPAALGLPLAGLGMLLLAGYVLSLQRPEVPPTRRRLRTASGVLMMILMGLLGFASSVVPTHDRRLMVLSWLVVVIVLGVVVLLACVDIVLTLGDALRARGAQRREIAQELRRGRTAARRADGRAAGEASGQGADA